MIADPVLLDLPARIETPRPLTEAVNGLVEYAFAHIAAVRIELITDEANTASRRLAERCGFTLEGILRHERRAPDDSLRNTCIYARLP